MCLYILLSQILFIFVTGTQLPVFYVTETLSDFRAIVEEANHRNYFSESSGLFSKKLPVYVV